MSKGTTGTSRYLNSGKEKSGMSSSSTLGSTSTSAGVATLAFTGLDSLLPILSATGLIFLGFVVLIFSRRVQPLPARA